MDVLSTTPGAAYSYLSGTSTTAPYTVNINRTGGFSESISLSATGLPAGAVTTFSPNPAPGTSSTMNVTTSNSTPPGTYPLTISGSSSLPPRTTSATLVVTSCTDGEC